MTEYSNVSKHDNSYGNNWELLKSELQKLLRKTGATLKREEKKEEHDLTAEIIAEIVLNSTWKPFWGAKSMFELFAIKIGSIM